MRQDPREFVGEFCEIARGLRKQKTPGHRPLRTENRAFLCHKADVEKR